MPRVTRDIRYHPTSRRSSRAAGWVVTIGVILGLLGADLLLATVRPHAVGYREAAAWSAFYVAVAVTFGVVFASLAGWDDGAQFFAGYIVPREHSHLHTISMCPAAGLHMKLVDYMVTATWPGAW